MRKTDIGLLMISFKCWLRWLASNITFLGNTTVMSWIKILESLKSVQQLNLSSSFYDPTWKHESEGLTGFIKPI